MSELLAIGISHRTAPVEIRERLALPQARAAQFVRDLCGVPEVHEAVAVSTCNRTELYLVVGDPVEAESAALGMLAAQAAIRPTELAGRIYSHRNCEAARHLYRVVSGLDSMLIGESEIQGQVRRAYEAALEQGTAGPFTSRLFQAALATGKRVRTDTSIGAGQLSLPAAAVALARERLGSLVGRRTVMIGTGETSELAARALADGGAVPVFVANRRRDRAIGLAQRFGGESVPLDELPAALVAADIVVAATSSPHLLLEERELGEVMRERPGRPLLLLDLAVPRDIDASCAAIDGVTLYDIDDLQAVAARARRVRQAQARRAEGIVEEEIQRFAGWLGALEALPTLAALRAHASAIADAVVEENRGRWESASERDLERVHALAHAVVNRLLHEPTARIKQLRDDRMHARMALIRELFALPDGTEGARAAGERVDGAGERVDAARERAGGPVERVDAARERAGGPVERVDAARERVGPAVGPRGLRVVPDTPARAGARRS
ncbi:MAG TPA: glutamyl-tRNA reductase [Solirubrobacteraceae bacterium]|nr:glutamyl-tRNA reductase [Solirubrobacteraceae bacterium]